VAEQETKNTKPKARYEFLDCARALAVILVVLEHFGSLPSSLSESVNLGRIGVIIFFCVSGFVIPLSIQKVTSVKQFLVGRLFRLYPAYWVSLIAHFVIWQLGGHLVHSERFVNPMNWIVNATMLQMFAGVKDISQVAWTLGIEWIIYATACVMIVRANLLKPIRLVWVATGILTAMAVLVPLLLNKRVPGALPQCLLASCLGYAYLLNYKQSLDTRGLTFFAVINVICQWACAYVNYDLFRKAGQELNYLTVVSSVLLGCFLFVALFLVRSFQFPKPVMWIGIISYSVYLLHGLVPVLQIDALPDWAKWVIHKVLIVAVSAASYYIIEKPFQAIGNRLRKSMTTPG
jgi:peptidoglycan/LPS O-acetylase OafA/YrhL